MGQLTIIELLLTGRESWTEHLGFRTRLLYVMIFSYNNYSTPYEVSTHSAGPIWRSRSSCRGTSSVFDMHRRGFCIYDYEHDCCLAELGFDGGLVPYPSSCQVWSQCSNSKPGQGQAYQMLHVTNLEPVESSPVQSLHIRQIRNSGYSPLQFTYPVACLPACLAFNTRRARTVVGSSNNSRVKIRYTQRCWFRANERG